MLPSRADLGNPLDTPIKFPTSYRAVLHIDTDQAKGAYSVSYQRDDRGITQKYQIESALAFYRFRISAVQAGRRLPEQVGGEHLISAYEGGAMVTQTAIDSNGNASPPTKVPLSDVPQIGILPMTVIGGQFVGRDTINGASARHYVLRYGFPTTDIWVDDISGRVVATRQGGITYSWTDYATGS